jgi:hypothetical protein
LIVRVIVPSPPDFGVATNRIALDAKSNAYVNSSPEISGDPAAGDPKNEG